jgi:hypothetical protein
MKASMLSVNTHTRRKLNTGIPRFAKVIHSMKTVCMVNIRKSKIKFPCTFTCKSGRTGERKLFCVAKMKFVK